MKNKKLIIRMITLIALLVIVYAGRSLQESEEETGNGTQEIVQNEPTPTVAGEEIVYPFRTQEQMTDHFERHGIEMGYDTEESYVAGANGVVFSPDALHKTEEEDGDFVYYLEETNEFVVLSPDGYIRTYFCPEDGIDYYNRQ